MIGWTDGQTANGRVRTMGNRQDDQTAGLPEAAIAPRRDITLLGAPVDCGSAYRGCLMGPDALRVAGLADSLSELGHRVSDAGNLSPKLRGPRDHPNRAIHDLGPSAGWVSALADAAFSASDNGLPIFLGGDHLMAAGTVAGVARRAGARGRPLFVLWLDAHTDFHDLNSTRSGNLHGTPVAYFTGRAGFDAFPPMPAPVAEERVAMLGIRSVDAAEAARIGATAINVADMRAIDEGGIARPLRAFLDRVVAEDGDLHVSFDVDFLDPDIAPAVGTTVPGGATFREAHLVMEMLHDSGRVTSLDIAELNPFLDDRGRTARLVVDLVASLFGKRVMDRPTRAA
ncbi:MAG: arginase [Phyllobacteriaceae bacterium]|nr:arginase [Phyllobacteriaceae bacterium]